MFSCINFQITEYLEIAYITLEKKTICIIEYSIKTPASIFGSIKLVIDFRLWILYHRWN